MKRAKKDQSNKLCEPSGISRREFARRAAAVAAGISVAPGNALAGGRSSAPSDQQPPAESLSPSGQMEADAKTQFALATYGSRLNDDQKKDLTRLIRESIKPLEELRQYALTNGVQPATVLRLYPEPGLRIPATRQARNKRKKRTGK